MGIAWPDGGRRLENFRPLRWHPMASASLPSNKRGLMFPTPHCYPHLLLPLNQETIFAVKSIISPSDTIVATMLTPDTDAALPLPRRVSSASHGPLAYKHVPAAT